MKLPTQEEKSKFKVDYAFDTDFSSFARLLQSKWRDSKKYPYTKYGNFLEAEFAETTKANFLTKNIKQLVTNAVENSKSNGAMIDEGRIWNNLLSSQPLCFNLFGEFCFDLGLATKYFKKLFPNKIDRVTAIKFEYSGGRGNKDYTGDHSAFDVFVEYNKNKLKGFIGIEVKYSESLQEEKESKALATLRRHFKEYSLLTNSTIFKPNVIDIVSKIPLSQIWRDHLLSIAHKKDYDEGFFVFLFPKYNTECQKGVDAYTQNLISKNEDETGFSPRYLDDFISVLREIKKAKWTKELENRYIGIKPSDMNTKHFQTAHLLNKKFKDLLLKNEVHFRASLNSIALLSISQNTPELGIKCNTKEYNIGSDLQNLIIKDIATINNKQSPKRSTPEKSLQAWIINYALNHNSELPFGKNIKFITSEIAMPDKNGNKIVADILGYDENLKSLCIIELKSKRELKRLIEQVNNFENIINENPTFFTKLVSISFDIDTFNLSKEIIKIIVWPYGKTSPLKKLEEANVVEITYENKYTFKSY